MLAVRELVLFGSYSVKVAGKSGDSLSFSLVIDDSFPFGASMVVAIATQHIASTPRNGMGWVRVGLFLGWVGFGLGFHWVTQITCLVIDLDLSTWRSALVSYVFSTIPSTYH